MGVPPIRLLDGVLIIVPYSISSCICLVFFICYFPKNNTFKKKNALAKLLLQGNESHDRVCHSNNFTYPFKLLLLLFTVVLIPLLLHIIEEFLSVHQKIFAMLLLPSVDLGFQTLFQLKTSITIFMLSQKRGFITFTSLICTLYYKQPPL